VRGGKEEGGGSWDLLVEDGERELCLCWVLHVERKHLLPPPLHPPSLPLAASPTSSSSSSSSLRGLIVAPNG
jgi:hypothetical protein